jgi:hypothetical protein
MLMTGFGLAGAIALGMVAPNAPARAAPSPFDGAWSVLVVTEQGTCDRAYRYAVRIQDGRVLYQGETGVDVSGQVTRDGRIHVNVGHADQRASGAGRLSRDFGSGRWSGVSSTQQCAGHWEAERRD